MVVAIVALVFAMSGSGYAALKLPKNSVGSKQIRTGAVGKSEIANESVTNAKLASGAVGAAELATDSVSGAVIEDGSVTAPDLAPGTIPAFSPLTTVASGRQYVPPDDVASAQAFCPAGMKVVSGGGSFIVGDGALNVTQANESGTGWFVIGANDSTISGTIEAFAHCAEGGKTVAVAAPRARAHGEEREVRDRLATARASQRFRARK